MPIAFSFPAMPPRCSSIGRPDRRFPGGDPQIPEVGPVVGSRQTRQHRQRHRRHDVPLLGQRTTLATAIAVPVTSSFNRTFDWEAQVQLNYYFGAAARSPAERRLCTKRNSEGPTREQRAGYRWLARRASSIQRYDHAAK